MLATNIGGVNPPLLQERRQSGERLLVDVGHPIHELDVRGSHQQARVLMASDPHDSLSLRASRGTPQCAGCPHAASASSHRQDAVSLLVAEAQADLPVDLHVI